MVWQTYGVRVGAAALSLLETINLKAGPKDERNPLLYRDMIGPGRSNKTNARLVTSDCLVSLRLHFRVDEFFFAFSAAIMINITQAQTVGVNDTSKVEVKSELTVK